MRNSEWSSDVCSADLHVEPLEALADRGLQRLALAGELEPARPAPEQLHAQHILHLPDAVRECRLRHAEGGRRPRQVAMVGDDVERTQAAAIQWIPCHKIFLYCLSTHPHSKLPQCRP